MKEETMKKLICKEFAAWIIVIAGFVTAAACAGAIMGYVL